MENNSKCEHKESAIDKNNVLVNTTFEMKNVSWSSLEAYENQTFIVKKSDIIKFKKRLWMYWTWIIKNLKMTQEIWIFRRKNFSIACFPTIFL